MSSSDDYYTALFFLTFLRYGIVTIFLDPEVPEQRANALILKAESKGVVMDEALFEQRNVEDNLSQFQLRIKYDTQKKGRLFQRLLKGKKEEKSETATSFPAILDALSEGQISLTPIESSDLAYVLFTSGTTSEPKGVMISHGNLLAQLQTLSKVYALDVTDRLHNILPLYHVDGIVQGPLLSLYNHATWLRPMHFDLSKINDLFHSFYKFRATHFFCVPLILSFMDKFSEDYEDSFQTEDFKCVISSAAQLEEKLWQDFERKFKVPIVNVYGMTETVAAALYCRPGKIQRKIGTVGVPIDCEAKIITPEGNIAKENETGVLWIKGENIFVGYFKNTESTADVLQDGWLNTGDFAVKDDEGFYTITGRVKNMINSGGINIYPEQVSEMINTHPDVLESICLGLEDDTIGEKLVSAVVLRPGGKLDKNDLILYLRPLLKQNQIPKDIFFFKDLPKGSSGKTSIKVVKELLANKGEENIGAISSNYESVIREAAAKAFGIVAESLTMEDTAQSIDGWDSMAHLVFITSLEKNYGIRFSTSEMMNMTSLKSADRILHKKLNV